MVVVSDEEKIWGRQWATSLVRFLYIFSVPPQTGRRLD